MIHHVFANRSNAGDWLSAQGIQKLLGRAGYVEHLCDAPFVPETLAALRQAGPGDGIVIGGGGLFSDYFTEFWTGLLPVMERIPCVLWGIGVCDRLLSPSLPPRELIEAVARTSRLCVVRDVLTRDFLANVELPAPVPCPTFNAVDPRPVPVQGTVLHVDHYENVGAAVFETMESAAAAHAHATGRKHRKTNNLLPAGNPAALEGILDLYRGAAVVLTSRLHGCILAAATGRPFLAVSGDSKVDSFMRSAGLERWVCPLDEVDRLPERLRELDAARPDADAFANAARQGNRAAAVQAAAVLGIAPVETK